MGAAMKDIVVFIILILFTYWIVELDDRIQALETKANSTVEILVERAYDEDMGVYDYQLVGQTEIKRSRKRMSKGDVKR